MEYPIQDLMNCRFEHKSGIYILLFPDTNKKYIGQTLDLNRRMGCYRKLNCKDQPKLWNAFNKYGVENIKVQIISYIEDKFAMDEIEKWHILYFNSIKNGYNICGGGGGSIGRKMSEEQKIKMSIQRTGIKRSEQSKINVGNTIRGSKVKESTSEYVGVHWSRKDNRWRARITVNNRIYELGTFDTQEDGAITYNKKAKELFGENAKLNNIPNWENKIVKKNIKRRGIMTSKYFGINYDKIHNKWVARITKNKNRIHIGNFNSELEAVIAYNKKAIELYGDEAKINILDGDIK